VRAIIPLLLLSFAALAQDADTVKVTGPPATKQEALPGLPNNGRPQAHIPFPQIFNWHSLKITLARTQCNGGCPSYSVEIDGDGGVGYRGDANVAVTGWHREQLPESRVHALFAQFQKADFFWLLDRYQAPISDSAAARLSIAFDGRTKTVVDYMGSMIGMPQDVERLERAIDSTADTRKWIAGDADAMASLRAENWDFQSRNPENLGLLTSAAEQGNVPLLRDLLAAGISARSRYGCLAVYNAAIRNGNAEITRMLLAAGAPVHREPAPRFECDALIAAAESGTPDIVRQVLAKHPDPNVRDATGWTPLIAAARTDRPEDHRERYFGKIATLLIAAGADPNVRDARGFSVLMFANQDADFVRALIAGGADVNAATAGGHTALMASQSSDVTQALLEAGANPWLKDHEGHTALDYADAWEGVAPTLKRWMTAHSVPPEAK
jgi:ankyrin repeat protein